MDHPVVSVWLITYNHEAYIAEAIEGVLQQQTNFAVELIIGEDCSTDGTRAIVQEYQRRYPDRITLFLPDATMGMVGILRPTYAMCRGKYVAMLDGDDYWTDPFKLQKQIDQLESNPTIRLSFHQVSVLNQKTGELRDLAEPTWSSIPGQIGLDCLLRNGNGISTLSVVFRNDFGGLPEWYYQLPYPDLALYFLVLMQGGVAQYIPDNMGIYRVHPTGWFSSMPASQRFRCGIEFLEGVRAYLPFHYQNTLIHELHYSYYEAIVFSLKKLELGSAAKSWVQLGKHTASTTTHRQRQWPHSVLLTGLKYTGRVLHRMRLSKAV